MDKGITYDEDRELRLLARGDASAFRRIYDRYSPDVYRAALRYLKSGDRAKDLVQEIFATVWEKRGDFGDVDNFRAYLITMSKNLALKHLKEISREITAKEEWTVHLKQDKESHASKTNRKELQQLLKETVVLLPEQQQQVFRMAKFEGLTYNAIADVLDISPNTVRNHIVAPNRFIRENLNKRDVLLPIGLMLYLFS